MCRGLHCEALRGSEACALLLYAQQYRQMEVHSLHPSPAFPLACPMSDGAAGGAKWVMEDCKTNILHWEGNLKQHKVWIQPQGSWASLMCYSFLSKMNTFKYVPSSAFYKYCFSSGKSLCPQYRGRIVYWPSFTGVRKIHL